VVARLQERLQGAYLQGTSRSAPTEDKCQFLHFPEIIIAT
jgi:hypothetical protein